MQAEDINKYTRLVLLITISSCSNDNNLTPDQLAQNALIIDTHIDTPIRLVAQKYQNIDLDDISGETDFDFDYPKAVAGGLNLPFFSIYVPARLEAEGTSFDFANEMIDLMDNIIESNSDYFFKVDTSIYLGNLPGQNLIGIAYGMENGSPLEGKLENVQYFHDKGIRYITLTHSLSNHISDSSYDENKQWGGLSPFGQALIEEMNKVGMMIDVSHVSDDAFYQIMDLSKVPVIASHSSLRHFTPGWERNMSDEMVKTIAKNGGVVQINFGSNFLINDNKAKDDSEEYILVHNESHDKQFNLNEINNKNIVHISPKSDKFNNIFFYKTLIENAKEIHCINSSFLHLVERIPTNSNLIYHHIRKSKFKLHEKWKVIKYED